MKIAVVGSRRYPHLKRVREFIISLPEDVEVVSGGAQGVDQAAIATAKNLGLRTKVFEANWTLYGKMAGVFRNEKVVDYSDEIRVFWDEESPGSRHAIGYAKKMGKKVVIVDEEGREHA